jgi:tetratricopeptide (TPR) repeat protein
MVKVLIRYQFFALLFISSYTLATEISTENIKQAYHNSYTLEKAQDYLGAINSLLPVLKAYPLGYTINYRLGWLTYLNGNFADALRYYKVALSIYPASIEIMSSISLVYKTRLEWSKVEAQNYSIIKIDYFNTTANFWYAYALKMQKKYDIAEKVCRKMLTVLPTSVTFLNELGEIRYYRKDKDEALSIFSSCVILDPYNENAKKFISLLLAK